MQTTYEKRKVRPEGGRYYGFDHVVFWVGNAKQAASYYVTRFGFEPFAYRGLETGERGIVSHVVRHNKVVFEFQSALTTDNHTHGQHLVKHGDGVKDVAFTVDNCESIYKKAVERGAKSVRPPTKLEDADGHVIVYDTEFSGRKANR